MDGDSSSLRAPEVQGPGGRAVARAFEGGSAPARASRGGGADGPRRGEGPRAEAHGGAGALGDALGAAPHGFQEPSGGEAVARPDAEGGPGQPDEDPPGPD
eukprot:1888047-Pyramimonas_sp.AAC.1